MKNSERRRRVCDPIGVAWGGAGGRGTGIALPSKMLKIHFNKNCAKFLHFFSAQNLAREAYSDHLGVRSVTPHEECP